MLRIDHRVPMARYPSAENELKLACQALGGRKKVADILGVSPSAVSQWDRCPVQHVLALEAAVRKAAKRYSTISRHTLRADIYPDKT